MTKLEKISKEREQHLVRSVENLISHIKTAGLEPTEALIKTAKEMDLNPQEMRRVTEAYNISKSLANQREKQGAARCEPFKLVLADEAIKKMYPQNYTTPGQEKTAAVCNARAGRDLLNPINYIDKVVSQQSCTDQEFNSMTKVAGLEEPKLSPYRLASQLEKKGQRAKHEISMSKEAFDFSKFKLLDTLTKVASEIKKSGMPMDRIEGALVYKYGEGISKLASVLSGLFKKAGDENGSNGVGIDTTDPAGVRYYDLPSNRTISEAEYHNRLEDAVRMHSKPDPDLTRLYSRLPGHILNGLPADALVGGALGLGYGALQGNPLEATGRGAVRGVGTSVGMNIGAALPNIISPELSKSNPSLAAGLTLGGAALGGIGGYTGAGALLGPSSIEKEKLKKTASVVIEDFSKEPFKSIEDFIKATNSFKKAAEDYQNTLKSKEQEGGSLSDRFFTKSGAKSYTGNVLGSFTNAFSVSDTPAYQNELGKAISKIQDPKYVNELRRVKVQSMLTDWLSNDDVLSNIAKSPEGLEKIISTYNDLAATSPEAAENPALAKAYVRRTIQLGDTDPHDLGAVLNIGSEIKKNVNIPNNAALEAMSQDVGSFNPNLTNVKGIRKRDVLWNMGKPQPKYTTPELRLQAEKLKLDQANMAAQNRNQAAMLAFQKSKQEQDLENYNKYEAPLKQQDMQTKGIQGLKTYADLQEGLGEPVSSVNPSRATGADDIRQYAKDQGLNGILGGEEE